MNNTEEWQQVVYFTGEEVEHTPMFGQRTLFVVGIQPIDELCALASSQNIKHIYLGTNQCFDPKTSVDWLVWDNMIVSLLKKGYWITLDFDVLYAVTLHEYSWCEFNTFIPMISVKLPNIKLFNYNATVKIDDTSWGATNPGVWCHALHELMPVSKFTNWSRYTNDEVIK